MLAQLFPGRAILLGVRKTNASSQSEGKPPLYRSLKDEHYINPWIGRGDMGLPFPMTAKCKTGQVRSSVLYDSDINRTAGLIFFFFFFK